MKEQTVEQSKERTLQRRSARRALKSAIMDKVKESLTSVLPITIIVLVLCFTIAPIPANALVLFIIGAVLLIVGMGLFSLGAETAMTPLGERVGTQMTKSRKLWLVLLVGFILGVMITISEPDLQVLAEQVPSIPNMTLILAVAVGVGLFLAVALLRIIIGIRLSYLLIGFYAVVFILAIFVPEDFLAVAFDSGGVTTGPITVPFIMALGVGASAIRSDKHAENDSFGLVALSSIGPIIAVMILSLVFNPDKTEYTSVIMPVLDDSRGLWNMFINELPAYIGEMALALAPILGFFIIFQIFSFKMTKRQVIRMLIGFVYTFIGLVLFLTGVNVGFMPVGNYLGGQIASLDYNWILIPIAMVMGYFIVAAEPAVHVLNKQVEEITSGAISQKSMSRCLSIGVALSLGLAMIRVMTGISIMWFLIPGYALAIGLTFFVPKIFTSIAFDSGGVASGPMTATFVLPFAMGACEALGGNIATDAFGAVAMVAMTPLITIQIMGVYYKIKTKIHPDEEGAQAALPEYDEDVIEL